MNFALIMIGNTILCALMFVPAFAVQMATLVGSRSIGARSLEAFIASVGFLLPVVPLISVVGSWLAFGLNQLALAQAFVVLPWIYALVLASSIAMLVLRQGDDAR